MKTLRTICLTLTLLLGSVGTSWGEQSANEYNKCKRQVINLNMASVKEWRELNGEL